MPENNEPQYELDHDYAPLGIVDAEDGSGTTWPEFVGHVNKMDNQVAALTEYGDSRTQELAQYAVNVSTTGDGYFDGSGSRIKVYWADGGGVPLYNGKAGLLFQVDGTNVAFLPSRTGL